MAERKAIPKKIRFEVLKRDKFTCQYCGRQAPDVVLNIDHITPIAKGGTNDITNLITSCFDCNSGKSDRELSDDAVVKKQKAQLDLLQERREQLEMMHEWQMQLTNEFMSETTIVADVVMNVSGYELRRSELAEVRKMIDQFGIQTVCDAARIAFTKYNPPAIAFKRIGGICYCTTHRTCYDCKRYIGANGGAVFRHTCSGKVNEDGEPIGYVSIKEAETCESFEVKQK